MELETLKDLYVDELKDIYNAENQLLKALPKMAKAASCTRNSRRRGLNEHHRTGVRTDMINRLMETIFEKLGESPKGKKCAAMEGLIKEGSELMEEDAEPETLDAGLISAAQKVEHYEIASYGCLRTYAGLLGDKTAEALLQQTLTDRAENR